MSHSRKFATLVRLVVVFVAASSVAASTFVVAAAQEQSPPAQKDTPTATPSATPPPVKPQTDERSRTTGDRTRSVSSRMMTGSITGRVVTDGGEPLSNVAVFIGTRGASLPAVPPAIFTTGEDGRFRVDNLAPTAYNVWTFLPGYVAVLDPLLESGTRRYHYIGDDVTITLTKGGVITGTVTDARGEAVVEARVRASYVRDPEGRFSESRGFANAEYETDDRGIYRIYGLQSGSYVVSIGGRRGFSPYPTIYDEDTPTFYPSATRDAAVEVSVLTGQEVSGIDIRYRGERGRTVSGTLAAVAEENGAVSVTLTHASTGLLEGTVFTNGRGATGYAFSFEGVGDGDYDLVARHGMRNGEQMASPPRRITVRGVDVTGLKLALAPLASVAGRIQFEPATATTTQDENKGTCEDQRGGGSSDSPLPQESVILFRRDDRNLPKEQARSRMSARLETTPDVRGEFHMRGLDEGRYHLETKLPGEAWYVRSVALNASAPAAARVAAEAKKEDKGKAARPDTAASSHASGVSQTPSTSRDALMLKTGERLTGLNINVAHGAAALRGQLVADDNARLPNPSLWRVYLVPAEREQADNWSRFAEAPVSNEQAFAFSNLAPGRYFLLPHPIDQSRTNESLRPLTWDESERARLRREAEAANILVVLQPCQRIEGFALRR
ncbi:MAG TPA: carboxypeptidase-like regulatory domain-containing protein [Pyrinomonadaceae bacterium]